MGSEGDRLIGVILANTGSPASPEPDDIEAYLREFLMDDRIRQMPKPVWKYLLHRHILPKRKNSSAVRYRFIWTDEGSPLVVNQQRLADKVQGLFDAEEGTRGDVRVVSAMSYGEPSIAGALSELREAGAERVVLLPLYPQSAYSPTMAVVDAFWRAQDAVDWHPESTVIDNYHDDPGYVVAIARSIRDAGFDASAGDMILMSFHAIPLKDEKAGDTYRLQVAESARLVADALGIGIEAITVAYQSVFGPDASKWTAPLSQDVLKGWRNEGFRVFFACPGFSIDCLETLYDVPFEMVPALEGASAAPIVARVGGDVQAACNTSGRFIWVPTLNDSDEHAALVKAVIGVSVTSATAAMDTTPASGHAKSNHTVMIAAEM